MLMEILVYNELNTATVNAQYERTLAMLQKGDFRAADAKKLRGTPYYRAKLNDADRLLFKFGSFEGKTYLLLLEVIYQHAYEKSRFLNGAAVDETKLEALVSPDTPAQEAEPLRYVNPQSSNFHFLGKILSFDDDQARALALSPPAVFIGSAGSGKTVLTLEKMKQLKGQILYVTHSPYLAECSRGLYYSGAYDNAKQEAEFLSFAELLATSGVPEGQSVDYKAFSNWFQRHRTNTPIKDGHMLFEEFNGVLTGCPVDAPYLTRQEYLDLGIRRSIFTGEERDLVYDLFEKYRRFLAESRLHNINMLAFSRLAVCEPRYDFVVVDEVQDITNVQLMFILKHLRRPGNFLLSGDSNQIVHPNFFSWSNLKSMFYDQQASGRKQKQITRILTSNYRNSRGVTELANKILLVKNARFGSVDRESNYLVRCVSDIPGKVDLLKHTPKLCREFNSKTSRSTRHAVLVLREEDKADAARHFETPLIFSVREAKGLEYENIILFNLISTASAAFGQIAEGVSAADLQRDSLEYARGKDKSDKSLEAFKFYINAFYVAVTRSVRNVFLLEQKPTHPLCELLELIDNEQDVHLEQAVSSEQEWQNEAGKLEQQGKTEQAEAIRKRVLGQKPVPWRVITNSELAKLEAEALDPERYNKKAKSLLFDYAIVYRRHDYLPRLAELKFKAAQAPEKHESDVLRRYEQPYHQRRLTELESKFKTYGPDFRDPLNRTPLMIAATLGMADLAKQLITYGASPNATDNEGRNAFMVGLMNIVNQQHARTQQLARLFQCVEPPPLTLRIGDKMTKIDPHHGLFGIVYAFLTQSWDIFPDGCALDRQIGLKNTNIAEFLELFPSRQVPDYRKRNPYISSLLAANEYARPGGRRLFLRFKIGRYLLNPELQLQLGERWVPVGEFCRLDEAVKSFPRETDRLLAQSVLDCLKAMQTRPLKTTRWHSTGGLEANELFQKHYLRYQADIQRAMNAEHEAWLEKFRQQRF
jgi:hypothetical protein